MQQQLLGLAPEGAVGYRVKVPSAGGRPIIQPKGQGEEPGMWRLHPFEPPRTVGEGRYRVMFVDAEGDEILALRDGLEPYLDIWWEAPESDAVRSANEAVLVARLQGQNAELRQKLEQREAELDQRKAEVEQITSEANAVAKMRALVTSSAERELLMAERTTAVAIRVLEAAETKATTLSQPPLPPPHIDVTAPIMEGLRTVQKLGVAYLTRDPEKLRTALGPARPTPAVPAAPAKPAESAPASTDPEAAPGNVEVVEVDVPLPEGTEAFADLIKSLTDEEREQFVAALADPTRIGEFFTRIRGKR